MEKLQKKIQTSLGPLYLVATSKELCGVYFYRQSIKEGEHPLFGKIEK